MPQDSIMHMANNFEPMYNQKMALFDQWLEEGDAWSKGRAHRAAHSLARGFATQLQAQDLVEGEYTLADFGQAADEILEEFDDYREEAIKFIVERSRAPQASEPMSQADVEHAEKYEELARRIGIDLLRELMPASPERIRRALDTGDRSLNTIALRKWDTAAEAIPGRGLSLGEKVCVLKHVAKWHYA